MEFTAKGKAGVAILALIAACGVGAWVYQLAFGLGVTGMSNANSWGLYICMFMLFVGLSAGGLIVASSAHVFGIKQFKPIAMPAVICSTVCICMAGMLVLIDMGGVQRVWRIVTGPNPTSPLVWDVCVISLYLIINILDLVWMRKGKEELVRRLSYVALPVAILVHSVTAWIFGLQIARAWYSAIMAPIFVASALDSGLAILIVSLLVLARFGIMELGRDLMSSLARLLAVFVCVDAYFIFCEVLTMGYPGAGETVALGEMLSGATAPFFWFEVACGLVLPFCILASKRNRRRSGVVAAASVLVILGVACKRIWLLFTSFIHPNVYGGPGITAGTVAAQNDPTATFMLLGSYAPTWTEVVVFAGVLAVGLLAFVFLSKALITKK